MADEEETERKRVFIGGLHHSVSEQEVKNLFQKYGRVLSVQKVSRRPDSDFPG